MEPLVYTPETLAEALMVSERTAYQRLVELQALGLGRVGKGRYLKSEVHRLLLQLSQRER